MNPVRPPKQGQTRRMFLRQARGLALAPVIVPAAALGAAGPGSSGNERIRVGVIGTGKMAHDYHLPELCRFADVQVVAVCDVDSTRRDHARRFVAERYAKAGRPATPSAHVDFREVVESPGVDAVLIATPDHGHALPILEACRAGKDVYCEKPLTLTIREAQYCIEAVRRRGVVFQTGSQQRSNVFGSFREAVEIVRSGRLGRIHRVTVGVGGPSRWCDLPSEPMEPGLDWDRWLGSAPMRPYHSVLSPRGMHNHFPNWRAFREYSGGGLTDMGAHHFDIAQWALDLDGSGPVEVRPPEDPAATTGAVLRLANGTELVHGGPSGCVFHGEHGTLRIDRGVLEGDPASLVTAPLGPQDVRLPKSPGHHRDWLDCIRSRRRPVAHVEAGARAATLCHLCNLAYWHRRAFRWDARGWFVPDDLEANGWLDVERRAPWLLPEV